MSDLTEAKKFGRLVAALRQELVFWDQSVMKSWSRDKLASETKISRYTIRDIENGNKSHINDDEIVALANALKLTTQERIEFVLAASFVKNKEIVQLPYQDNLKPLPLLIDRLRGTHLPLYISDVYGDVIAVNDVIVHFYGVPTYVLDSGLGGKVSKFNMMRFVFDKLFREILGERWEIDVKSNVQYFRGESLRYRATKYWQETFGELLDLDDFPRIWQGINYEEDNFSDVHPYKFTHPTYGVVSYYATVSTTTTHWGNLRSVVYVPNNDNARNGFADIAQKHGCHIHRLASWPKVENM